jgi:hypothetical protein
MLRFVGMKPARKLTLSTGTATEVFDVTLFVLIYGERDEA